MKRSWRCEVNFEELPEVLTVEEAAAVLRIGRTAAYELCRQWRATRGRTGIPVLAFGRTLRVPKAALVRMLETSGGAA
jgi:Helix-turn-helix domain